MEKENQVRELLGTMLMLPPASVTARTSLVSIDNSLGEVKLRLGLRRLGLNLSPGSRAGTFGELCELLSGKPVNKANHAPHSGLDPLMNAVPGSASIGLDVQDIGSLPLATDYWEDEFYSHIFGKSEIAYAVKNSEPRTHFAGFWCAKEALRKCDPSFAQVEPAATVTAHETGGRPFLLWKRPSGEIRLPHALSISHAGTIAMAVVMSAGNLK
jgi:phosphopantetheinyl transferase (holo-ACP synthase)